MTTSQISDTLMDISFCLGEQSDPRACRLCHPWLYAGREKGSVDAEISEFYEALARQPGCSSGSPSWQSNSTLILSTSSAHFLRSLRSACR